MNSKNSGNLAQIENTEEISFHSFIHQTEYGAKYMKMKFKENKCKLLHLEFKQSNAQIRDGEDMTEQ